MGQKLTDAGFINGEKTLFIWEGVSYYLAAQTVDETLQFIRRNTAAGSTLCFDYMLPLADITDRYGAQQSREAMQTTYTAELLQFDISGEKIGEFLAERGFEITEHLSTEDMERRYLTLADGTSAGKVLDLFGLVLAATK